MTDLPGFQIFYSEAIPKETLYLMPAGLGFDVGPILFRRDPWEEPSYPLLGPEYRDERQRGLDFLADLLDRTYTDLGWSPDEWREAKWREQSRHDAMRFMAHERLALDIVNPNSVCKVVITP